MARGWNLIQGMELYACLSISNIAEVHEVGKEKFLSEHAGRIYFPALSCILDPLERLRLS